MLRPSKRLEPEKKAGETIDLFSIVLKRYFSFISKVNFHQLQQSAINRRFVVANWQFHLSAVGGYIGIAKLPTGISAKCSKRSAKAEGYFLVSQYFLFLLLDRALPLSLNSLYGGLFLYISNRIS